jgi:hypothetical protein
LRLDYIFVSRSIVSRISGASIDWAFESSVKIDFTFEEEPVRGPGIVKVNTKILDDPAAVLQIGKEIEEMMSQTDDGWNTHARLEFLKVAIHSVFSWKISDIRKVVNEDITETEEELNQIENLKVIVLSRPEISKEERNGRVDIIEKATESLKSKFLQHRKKFSDTMAFVSRAKLFEYGEKSNKFFLNLT